MADLSRHSIRSWELPSFYLCLKLYGGVLWHLLGFSTRREQRNSIVDGRKSTFSRSADVPRFVTSMGGNFVRIGAGGYDPDTILLLYMGCEDSG
jgi:hypothetical protein